MVEWIGFVISLLALMYLFISQNSGRARQRFPEEFNDETMQEEDPLLDLIREIENEGKKNEHPPRESLPKSNKEHSVKKVPTVPKKKESIAHRQIKSELEERRIKPSDLSDLDERRLTSSLPSREEWARLNVSVDVSHLHHDELKRKSSRARKIVSRLAHRRDLLVYQEIMSKPLGLRSE